jgi:hypothetical protein
MTQQFIKEVYEANDYDRIKIVGRYLAEKYCVLKCKGKKNLDNSNIKNPTYNLVGMDALDAFDNGPIQNQPQGHNGHKIYFVSATEEMKRKLNLALKDWNEIVDRVNLLYKADQKKA